MFTEIFLQSISERRLQKCFVIVIDNLSDFRIILIKKCIFLFIKFVISIDGVSDLANGSHTVKLYSQTVNFMYQLNLFLSIFCTGKLIQQGFKIAVKLLYIWSFIGIFTKFHVGRFIEIKIIL